MNPRPAFPRAPLALGLVLGLGLLAGCGPASALLHDPQSLPCLQPDCQIRYEPGARAYAEAVAKLLDPAVAQIEGRRGRPFGSPIVVVVHADEDAYVAANGRGDARPSGVAFMDRVTLSPRLWREEPDQLKPYLTHELSHAHLLSHISTLAEVRIPSWFVEGLAVMASDGGGAQLVSTAEAQRAIDAGSTIETPDRTGAFGETSLPFVKNFHDADPRRQAHMAYRQAGLFVAFLRDRDRRAFGALLDRLLNGKPFAESFRLAYGAAPAALWADFAKSLNKGS
jgi:hypothetical protein